MKKYCLKLLIIFVLLTLILSFPYSKASLPLFGKTITIDIGHGGKDPGTVVNNILEKDINLKIGKYLEKENNKQSTQLAKILENGADFVTEENLKEILEFLEN